MDVATAAELALLLRPSHMLTRDEKLERRRLQYKLHQRRHRARQIQLSQSLQHYVQRLHQEIAQLEAMRATLLRPRIERSVRRIGGAASHTAIEYLRQFTYGLHGRNAAAIEQFVRCIMVTNVGGPDFCGIDELLHQWRLYGQFFHRAQYVPDGVRVIATDNLVVVVIVHVTLVIRASRTGVLCLWPKLRHDEAAIHAMADKEVRVPGTMRFLFDTNGVCTWLGADMDFVAGLQHLLGDLSKVRLCMDDTNMTFDTGQITASLGDSEMMAVARSLSQILWRRIVLSREETGQANGLFQRKPPSHPIPTNPPNVLINSDKTEDSVFMVLEGKRGQWGFRRLRRWCYRHLTGALQDFQAVLSLEQAAEMATTRAQEERDVDDRVDREKEEEEEEGEEEDEEHVEFGHPSPSDRYNDDGQDEEDEETPQLASRYGGVKVHDTMTVTETTVDRTGPTLAEVQSLGPIEELEAELFDKVEREVPASSGTTKQVFVCKFCTEEFTYMVRDMHTHKNVCAKYPGRESMTRVVRTVPDEENREIVVDMEVEGEPKDANAIVDEDEDEVNRAKALVADDTKDEDDDQQEEAHAADEEDVGMGRDSGNPGDKGEQEEEDETQMLEDKPIKVLFPGRVEMPDETDEPRPILKVAKIKLVEVTEPSHDVDMNDAPRESDTTKTDDRGGDDDVVEEHGSPENASETASTGSVYGSGRDAYRTAFHLFTDSTGEHAECLHCGRVCSNRGSAMATHYKSCAARSHANATQHRCTIHQLITPKKKTTKRRISGQEFELLEEETTSQANESDDDSQPGSPPLRRSKRFKAESKGDGKVSNPATEIEPLNLMGDTTSTTAATDATTTTKRPKPTKPNDTNDLDGYPLSEFDLVAHDKRLQCQHCHSEMVFREYIAEKHLRECENYKANRTPSTTMQAPLSKTQKRGKTTDRDGASVSIAVATLLRHPERLRAADILGFNHDAALQWIFGSCPIDRIRSHYGKSPMVVRSPVARFRAVEAEFADLHVAKLLAQLPLATTITAMVPRPTRDGQEYATAPLTSASAALTMYESNCPLVVRAPAIVAHMFVPHFAKALGCGSMVATDQHDVVLLCAQGPLRLDWQYHKNDSFVVCLRGKAVWKMRANVVTAPPDSFHLSSTNPANRERVVAMQVASLGVASGRTTVPVPTGTTFDFATDSDGEEDRAESTSLDARLNAPLTDQQMVADAGAVVYIPAGTWYCVGGLEGASVLLQFQMKTVKVKEILSDLVQQLVVTQPKYREAIKDAVDGDAAVPQQFVLARLRDLATQLTELSSNEILPELLVTTDTKPASVIYDGGDDRATRVYRFDLRDPNNFQGGQQVHFYKRSTFRVTPLAVLMRLDELPPPLKRVETMMSNLTPPTAAATLSSTLTSTKKVLHRKTKRAPGVASSEATQRPHTLSSLDTANSSKGSAPPPGIYNLLLGLGGVGKPPRLKVQFWCNAAQQAMIEWIRTRDTPEPFCVSELAKVLAHHQGGHADFELLKVTLRFLCAMGYLINVDVPLL